METFDDVQYTRTSLKREIALTRKRKKLNTCLHVLNELIFSLYIEPEINFLGTKMPNAAPPNLRRNQNVK